MFLCKSCYVLTTILLDPRRPPANIVLGERWAPAFSMTIAHVAILSQATKSNARTQSNDHSPTGIGALKVPGAEEHAAGARGVGRWSLQGQGGLGGGNCKYVGLPGLLGLLGVSPSPVGLPRIYLQLPAIVNRCGVVQLPDNCRQLPSPPPHLFTIAS